MATITPRGLGPDGFVALPPLFFVYLIAATLPYLASVEATKALFYWTIGRAGRDVEVGPQVH